MIRDILIRYIDAQYGCLEDGYILLHHLLKQTTNIKYAIYQSLQKNIAEKLILDCFNRDIIKQMYQRYKNEHIHIVTIVDKAYPKCLLTMTKPPLVLFYKGNDQLWQKKRLSITGTEQMTYYGQQIIDYILKYGQKWVICSAMFSNMSTFIYEQCFQYTVDTIAILSTGFDCFYPLKHLFLQKRLEKKGLVITEYPLMVPFQSSHLSRQRELLAGISSCVCLVEAEKNSYCLKTAYTAIEQSKDVIVPPGNIFSITNQGTNELLQQGAIPLLSIEDIDYTLNTSIF